MTSISCAAAVLENGSASRATIRALNTYRKASPNKDEPEYLAEFAGE